MILNIDFNPIIQQEIKTKELILNKKNIIEESIKYPGGTGIILEWLLNVFNEKTFLTGFLGSGNGEYLSGLPDKTDHEFILIKDLISESITIKENNRKTIIQSPDPRITKEEITMFYNRYDSLLENHEYIIGSSRVPEGLLENIHEKLAKIARIKNKKYILEVNNKEDLIAIKENPYIVIMSKKSLENISNLILDTKESIAAANNYILRKGAKNVLVNLYEDGLVYSSKEQSYFIADEENKIDFENKENYGLIAGILIGLIREYELEISLKLAYAYNISYNNNDIMNIRMNNIKKDMANLVMEKINRIN